MASSTRPVSRYLIALGSNRPGRHGGPADEVRAALAVLAGLGTVVAAPVVASAPIGPSIRRFANTVAQLHSPLDPPALLARLQAIECGFGRRRGRRWGARVLDLDVVLWSGGRWRSHGLTIPHTAFRQRRFVLDPLAALVPAWRDPGPESTTGLTMRHLAARLTTRRPAPRSQER